MPLFLLYRDSRVPLLRKSEIPSLFPSSVVVQPGLCRSDLVGNPEDRFSCDVAHMESLLRQEYRNDPKFSDR